MSDDFVPPKISFMSDEDRTLEHYRSIIESLVRKLEVYEPRYEVRFDPSLYSSFRCTVCFRDIPPNPSGKCDPVDCLRVGDEVEVIGCPDEGIGVITKAYTFHYGRYGTMMGAKFKNGYYEYFVSRLRRKKNEDRH